VNSEPDQKLGMVAATAAFTFWGLSPIYFKFLGAVPAPEIIAHRIFWAIPVLIVFLLVRDGRYFWRRMRLPRKTLLTLLLSGLLVSFNWLIFVWAVAHDRILETSLGYFINPLVNVVLGYLFLHERLTRIQSLAVLIAAGGTIYLTWFLGVAPWIALFLGISFGFYGLVRKKLAVGPMIGLLWETLLLITPALLYFAWTAGEGSMHFMQGNLQLNLLLIFAGLVTVLPLIGFNMAAKNLSLTQVGFFQYLAPSISFVLAVFLYDESFTRGHAVAFSCIWLALILVSVESVVRSRRIGTPAKSI
jgi:chloramphenicol-sensitive protein RarD